MKRSTQGGVSRRGAVTGAAASLAAFSLIGAPAIGQSRSLKIGALLPLTGGLTLHAEQMWLGIQATAAEINAAGGVLGRPLEVIYRDAQGGTQGLPAQCHDLVRQDGVSAIVGPFIAAGRKAASRALKDLDVPLVCASNNEGNHCLRNFFSLGPVPNQDTLPLIHHLDGGEGRRYYLVGSFTSWQAGGFREAALDIMNSEGGKIIGQAHTNIGEKNFEPIIRHIDKSDADTVIFCVPRPQGAGFISQARTYGLLKKVRIGWVGFNELHTAQLSPDESSAVTTVSPFVAADDEGGVPDLVARMHSVSNPETTVTYYAFTHYAAVTAIAEACRKTGDISSAGVLGGLPNLTFESATGPVTIDAASHHASYNLVVARGDGDRLAVVERLGQIAADPGCSAA